MLLTENQQHTEFADTLGGRIVNAREAQDLSASQLAGRMGIRTETLHDWETDRAEPQSNRLTTLAGMLNVSPAWLRTGSGDRPDGAPDEAEMMHIRDSVVRIREQVLTLVEELEQLQRRLEAAESDQA